MARREKDNPGERKALWAAAARRIFAPVVRTLLEEGLDWPEVVCVLEEAAAAALRQPGRRLNPRVSASVAEVVARSEPRLRQGDEPDDARARSALGIRLIGRWLSDPRFATRKGPRSLPLSGPRSFATLASMSGAGFEQALRVLTESGAARVERGRRVALTEAAYVPFREVEQQFEIGVASVVELIGAVFHNLRAGPRADRFLQRRVSYDNVPRRLLPVVRGAIQEAAQAAVLAANRIIGAADRDRSGVRGGGGRARVSFGVYC